MTAPAEGRQAPWSEIEKETKDLLRLATESGLTLRTVGSTGIRLHCFDAAAAMDRSGRPPKDIDVVGLSGERTKLRKLLEGRGYELDRDVLVAMEGARYCCTHTTSGIELDVFFDRLEFCHTIELVSRMKEPAATIPVEDLLLQKLQVHELTDSDSVDAAIVLAVHEVAGSSGGGEVIDASYVAKVLANDWGFHRTATENLDKIEQRAEPVLLGEAASRTIRERIGELRVAIDAAPKSLSWRLRSRVGERVQWWNDVSERELTY